LDLVNKYWFNHVIKLQRTIDLVSGGLSSASRRGCAAAEADGKAWRRHRQWWLLLQTLRRSVCEADAVAAAAAAVLQSGCERGDDDDDDDDAGDQSARPPLPIRFLLRSY